MKEVSINITSNNQEEIILSKVFNVATTLLKEHPLNSMFNHDSKEIEILKSDIQKRGILVPLILKGDNTILAGHKRKKIADILNIYKVPAQKLLSELSPERERELLFKDNIVRRQLKYKDKKLIIKTMYEHEIFSDHRGRFIKNQALNPRYSNEYYEPLHIRIERETGINRNTALRILAEIRKEANGFDSSESTLKKFNKHFSSIKKLTLAEGKDFRKIVRIEFQGFLKQI